MAEHALVYRKAGMDKDRTIIMGDIGQCIFMLNALKGDYINMSNVRIVDYKTNYVIHRIEFSNDFEEYSIKE